jgi:hypothetical protein
MRTVSVVACGLALALAVAFGVGDAVVELVVAATPDAHPAIVSARQVAAATPTKLRRATFIDTQTFGPLLQLLRSVDPSTHMWAAAPSQFRRESVAWPIQQREMCADQMSKRRTTAQQL